MTRSVDQRRADAAAIWRAGVDAVRPERCLPQWFADPARWPDHFPPLTEFARILVVGGGKAGAAMSAALESALSARGIPLDRVSGSVNVPNESVVPLKCIRLHPSRPAGVNEPTAAALVGTARILQIAADVGPDDLLVCLLSGGGSALLPAPVEGVSLADKLSVTRLLSGCGASIHEMNAVRKHLSQIKGGGLVRRFRGRSLLSLILSDVVGDPLDVIASGPTCVDPTTYADAVAVFEKYGLEGRIPSSVANHLRRGWSGHLPETLKEYPRDAAGRTPIANIVLANNGLALAAAEQAARACGYHVLNLGSAIDGDTDAAAEAQAAACRDLQARRADQRPFAVLSGGETTVVLPPDHGQGGRNQHFALAFAHYLQRHAIAGITVLCGGTDGEDGTTDAAGAFADELTLARAAALPLSLADSLRRRDAYTFFQQTGGLFVTGLTNTNVMDLRVVLIDK